MENGNNGNTSEGTRREPSAANPERQAPLSPLVAAALEGGSGTLRSRLDRIRKFSANAGRYTILGEVGEGGMGQVQRVWDEVLDRELAVKRVELQLGGEAAPDRRERHRWKLERFIEEARVTGQLEHPGIVPIHDIALDEDGTLFFTMPLIQGDTVKKIFKLARNRLHGWTIHRALGVIHKVCQTVAFAHQSGVVHRDLKPDNVMVGRFGEVYVMDWGLALILGKQDRESVVGTPAYMSPEQASGCLEDVGPQSDVYSIGALIYELFAGRMPHEKSLEEERAVGRSLDDILSQPPRPLGQITDRAPAELLAIVDKAMSPRPEDRYRDMLEIANDLSAWIEGRVVNAYDARMVTRWKKWRRRNRPLAYALDAIALLVVSSISVILYQQRDQIHEVRAANEKIEANSYMAKIAAADLELRVHRAKAAKRWLETCEKELRGWEWGHLNRLADASAYVLEGHKSSVRAIDVSSDGRFIATGDDAGVVRIWDSSTYELVHELDDHEDVVTQVAFHPRERVLASASRDETVRIRNLEADASTTTIDVHGEDVVALAYDPRGQLLLSGDHEGTIAVTRLEHPLETTVLHTGQSTINALAFDPERRLIVASAQGNDELILLDPTSGALRGALPVADYIRDVAVDPGGRRYAVTADRTVMIVRAEDLAIESILSGHTKDVQTIAFDDSGKLLASGGFDNVVHLWDLASGERRLSFDGHELGVNSVAFHPDGLRLMSASEDDTARIWDLSSGAQRILEGHTTWGVNAVRFSSDGRTILSGGNDKTLRTWNASTGSELHAVRGEVSVASIATGKGGRIAYGSNDGELHVTSSNDLEQVRSLAIGAGHPRAIVFDSTGTRVYQKSSEGFVTGHDLTNGERLFGFDHGDDDVFSIALDPSARCLAIGTAGAAIDFHDATTGELLGKTRLESKSVQALAYDPGGTWLACGTSDARIFLISTATREPLRAMLGHAKFVSALAFSPDGERLVSGSFDETLRLWNLEGELLLTLFGHTQPLTSLAFDPSGSTIVSASKDGTIRLWRGK